MPLIKQIIISDLITALWLVVIFIVVFLWLPFKSLTGNINQQDHNQIISLWLRIIFVIILGVLSLSYLHLLNWLTLALIYTACLIFNYLESSNWQIKKCWQLIQIRILNLIDILDRGFLFTDLLKSLTNNYHRTQQQFSKYLTNLVIRQGMFFVVVLTIVLGFALLLRSEHPLLELRFSHSDRYAVLLTTRQILLGNYPETDSLPVFSALAAGVSLLSSIDAMQAIRFLSPIIGMIMVFSVGYLMRVFTNAYSALVAMFACGVYIFTWEVSLNTELSSWLTTVINSLNNSLVRQWTGNELELGVIFFLLGLGYYFSANSQHRQTVAFKLNIIASIILVSISAPQLIILVAIAAIASLGNKRLILSTITFTWLIFAVLAAINPEKIPWTQSFLLTLPVALSFLTGLLFLAVTKIVKLFTHKWAETFCLALFLSLTINFLLPFSPNLTYVEYDMAARKSLELRHQFSPHTWTLVAPVEQLAEVYGAGGYQDLALFVEKYANQVSNPEFKFPITEQNLFILVEKIPFVTFPNEPSILPDTILKDATYRYYRSSAGRASLEYEAMQMCETYRQSHPDSEIYYEDRELRVYHF
ncbi:MAG: hypothetical protein ACRC2S_19415 [Waterburya sp.]